MPTTAQLRTRLISKLKELFQLDQPDLDFGFYRIMHAKAEQVERFIDNDLLKIVDEAFAGSDKEKTESELDAAKRKLVEAMGDDVFNSDGTIKEDAAKYPAGKAYVEAVTKAGSQVASLSDEGQVYDHLFRFFERYYDNGDFVSRRYYTRETDGRAAPFAIPYNGEEVKLHWANADQYYIKTAEYFNNYTFDLTQAAEFRAMNVLERAGSGVPDKPVKVHFKIVDASEGEHGNVKAKDDDKRFFIIHQDDPVTFDENGELVVQFEYRADPEKGSKQEGSWRDFRNTEAVEVILKALNHRLTQMDINGGSDGKEKIPVNPGSDVVKNYIRLFEFPAPTEKDKKRPLLAKYLNQYTARNTMDYFIHKNLGGFLRRELDFYIKNEVMRLDDLDQADAPAVESYLSKLKVLRKIAHKLIDFLAQLEDFQKKLWLKKKFVVETNYCITLDRVSEELYPEIAANNAQREEWVKLFAIDEIEASTVSPGYADPLTVDFLKANDKLVLDTKFFDARFKAHLLEAIEDFDAQCDGLLVHSENFQALNLLQKTFKKQFKGIYIDPPYNTGNDGFVYRDAYQHSSWLSMVFDRVAQGRVFAADEAAIFAAIDEGEQPNFRKLFDVAWGAENFIADMVWAAGRKNDSRLISVSHEYMLVYANNKTLLSERKVEWRQKKKGLYDIYAQHNKLRKEHGNDYATMTEGLKAWFKDLPDGHPAKAHKHYSHVDHRGVYFPADISWPGGGGPKYEVLHPVTKKPVKVPKGGWRFSKEETMQEWIDDDRIHFGPDENSVPCRKSYLSEHENQTPYSVFYQDGRAATRRLRDILGSDDFGYPKDETVVAESIAMLCGTNESALDYFAGSGTTGHAVIALNREDKGNRSYSLVEMGGHFDSTLMPRLKKVVYSTNWKDGKPTSRDTGISHCFKYIRLESYEDTLNNLTFDENAKRTETIERSSALKEDYMLRYLLDVETRGSQSLLNIDAFADPTAYRLTVKKPGSDEQETRYVDLIETFNYLIGLRVMHYAAPQSFTAKFKRTPDPELPEDQHTKLIVDGNLQQIKENHGFTQIDTDKAEKNLCSSVSICGSDKVWWFRKVEGWVPKNPSVPDHETREKNPQNMERILIVWRKLTGDLEQDNLMLDVWFRKHGISTQDYEYDTIYVNGSNNLPNLKHDNEHWKVRLIEEEFMKRMWDISEA